MAWFNSQLVRVMLPLRSPELQRSQSNEIRHRIWRCRSPVPLEGLPNVSPSCGIALEHIRRRSSLFYARQVCGESRLQRALCVHEISQFGAGDTVISGIGNNVRNLLSDHFPKALLLSGFLSSPDILLTSEAGWSQLRLDNRLLHILLSTTTFFLACIGIPLFAEEPFRFSHLFPRSLSMLVKLVSDLRMAALKVPQNFRPTRGARLSFIRWTII